MLVYLGLGTNQGEREENFYRAITELESLPETKILRKSSIIETIPWGLKEQPDFLNFVLEVETQLSPRFLLESCLDIERKLGRVRDIRWGPRLIDIDILLYGNRIIEETDLVIPHEYLHKRQFVLCSLMELIPEFVHPKLKKSIDTLYKEIQ